MNASNTNTPETLTRKAVVGTGWSAASVAGRQVLSLISVSIVARLLGPGAYGVMGMAALITAFLSNFRDMGTAAAIVQRPIVPPRLVSSLFWANLVIGATLMVLTLAFSVPAAVFFHEPQVGPVMRVLSVSFFITSAGVVHQALLTREMAFEHIAKVDFGSALAGFAAAVCSAYAGFGVWALVFANIATSAVSTSLYWILSKWRPSWEFDAGEIRSITGFSLNLSGFTLVNYFSRNADNIIIGRVLGSVPLGYYQMAYTLMLYPIWNISSVIGQVLFPAFSQIQNDNERFRSAYVRSCMLLALITFPVFAGLGVVADPFIRAVLGAKWIPALTVFQILVPVGLIQSIQTMIGHIYVAKARTDLLLSWGIASAAVYVTAFLIGIRYGITGVAVGYALAYIFILMYPGFAIPFRLIDLRFRDFVGALLPQIAITSAMSLACTGWLRLLDFGGVGNQLVRLITTAVLGVFVYIGAMLFFRPPVVGYLQDTLGHSPILSRFATPLLRLFPQAR